MQAKPILAFKKLSASAIAPMKGSAGAAGIFLFGDKN